jgi:PTH1 family peptidyl-tRNA hydrolase
MNILGPLVPPLLSSLPSAAARPTLLVLHDSLSANPMSIVVPRTNVSAQGHNGLRSCEASLKSKDYWRMGLGIGRPQGSGKGGVSEWVLGKLSLDERLYWEGEGVQRVMREIEGWARKRIVE